MTPAVIDPDQNRSKRRRLGCLGCVGKLLGYLLGFAIFGSLLVLAIDAVFAPWSFFMGGSFHLIPMWRGWGRLHSKSGRDYILSVWFEPAPSSGTRSGYGGAAHVQGWATLCAPNGQRFSLRASGYMERHMGTSTEGKRMDLRVYRRPWYFSWVGKWDNRPRLEFRGAWHHPNLVLGDGGSLDRAFNSDGTLRSGPAPLRVPGERGVQVTLHESSKSESEAACREIQSR